MAQYARFAAQIKSVLSGWHTVALHTTLKGAVKDARKIAAGGAASRVMDKDTGHVHKQYKAKRNPARKRSKRRNAGTSTRSATRTATSTKATTTGNKTGTSTGGAVSGGGGNITVSVKRNPPQGFIPCRFVKIERKNGAVKVRIRK